MSLQEFCDDVRALRMAGENDWPPLVPILQIVIKCRIHIRQGMIERIKVPLDSIELEKIDLKKIIK